MSMKYKLIDYQGVRLFVLDEFKKNGAHYAVCLDFRAPTDGASKYCMALLKKCGIIRPIFEHVDFDNQNLPMIRMRLRNPGIFSAMDAMVGLQKHSLKTQEHELLAAFIADLRAGDIL